MDKFIEIKENAIGYKIDARKRSLSRYIRLKEKSINEKERTKYKNKIKEVETDISDLRKAIFYG